MAVDERRVVNRSAPLTHYCMSDDSVCMKKLIYNPCMYNNSFTVTMQDSDYSKEDITHHFFVEEDSCTIQ